MFLTFVCATMHVSLGLESKCSPHLVQGTRSYPSGAPQYVDQPPSAPEAPLTVLLDLQHASRRSYFRVLNG